MKRSPRETRLRVCWHESGHAIVADSLGVDWRADVLTSPKAGIGGNCVATPWPRRLSKRDWAMFALGGPVVDYSLTLGCGSFVRGVRRIACDGITHSSLIDWLSDGTGSVKDHGVIAACKQWRQLVKPVARILLERAADVRRLRRLLDKRGSVSQWEFQGCPMPTPAATA